MSQLPGQITGPLPMAPHRELIRSDHQETSRGFPIGQTVRTRAQVAQQQLHGFPGIGLRLDRRHRGFGRVRRR
jgi:hypothetical protein